MARWDEDVEGRAVSPLRNYHAGATGAVVAAPILRGSTVDGYLYRGVGAESQRAGIDARRGSDFDPAGAKYWRALLRERFSEGVPAAEAFDLLLGAAGPEEAGRVGSETVQFPSRQALFDALNPQAARSEDRRTGSAARATPSEIDSVLRGETRPSEAVETAIRDMDLALVQRPTPDPVLVSMTRDRGSLPESLTTGTVVQEPTYLVTELTSDARSIIGGDVLITLRVPSGVPALIQPPALPAHPPRLLLARGLSWRVLRVVEGDGRLLVTAELLAAHDG